MKYFKTLSILLLMTGFISISAQKTVQTVSKPDNSKNNQKDNCGKDADALHFVQFGIMAKSHEDFKNRYCVNVFYENCVITGFLAEKAKKNNLKVAEYLTKKYGESWKKDLGFIPYGL